MPTRKPTAAGIHAIVPDASAISMAGSSSEKKAAAIITPEAKPKSAFSKRGFIAPRRKNTSAAPKVVPSRGRASPVVSVSPALIPYPSA